MADNNGWISLHRQVQNHWIWKDPIKFQWWIDILLTVNNSDAKVNLGNDIFDCKRGESLMSLQGWASRWKVSKDSARNFLKLLEKDKMIVCVSVGKSTRITVCKYDDYQSDLRVKQTRAVRVANASQTQTHPNNNDNNDNNDNKHIEAPTLSDVKAYFSEKGYSDFVAEKAFNYYDSFGWKNRDGKKVKNWKMTMQTVWFKEENKLSINAERKFVH